MKAFINETFKRYGIGYLLYLSYFKITKSLGDLHLDIILMNTVHIVAGGSELNVLWEGSTLLMN